MVTKVHEETSEAPVKEAGANGSTQHKGEVSTLDDILAIDDIQYETVYVSEWDRSVRLVSLTGEDRNSVAMAAQQHAKKLGNESEAEMYFQARIILASWVDADGNHIGDQSKAPALMKKSGGALTRLFLVCCRLSGIGREEEQEALAALKGTPSAATGSD